MSDKKRHMDAKELQLKNELEKVKQQLEYAYREFNAATEPELVEASVYSINAMQAKYAFLLRKIKETGRSPIEKFKFPRNESEEAKEVL